ncbi:MAG TPA: hypothetical protein VIJ16_01995 [Gemmatimonadaceae bacterium]
MSGDIVLSPRMLAAAVSACMGILEAATREVGVAPTPDDLAAFGRAHNLLRRDAREGDILLQYSPVRRGFVRAGLVVSVVRRGSWTPGRPYVDVLAIEVGPEDLGDAEQLGGTGGMCVERRLSAYYGDRFLRRPDARVAPRAAVKSEAA